MIWKVALEEDDHPCSPVRYPGNCYQVGRDICVKQWTNFQEQCKKQIGELNLPPTRLIGPIMDFCQKSKYDRIFHYLRKQNQDCDSEMTEIENWRRSNPGF